MNDTGMEIGRPKNFRMPQVLIVNALGVLLGLPCGVALGAGIVAIAGGLLSGKPILLVLGIVALLVSAGIFFFLPVLNGNPYITKLVRAHSAAPIPGAAHQFLVQLALHPRLHGGIRGWLEDADDIGYLTVSSSGLSFHGDHVSLRIPSESISRVYSRNVGVRGSWVCGRRIHVTSPMLANLTSVEFMDRSAVHVPGCRKNTDAIMEAISSIVRQERPNQTPDATSEAVPGAASSTHQG